MAKVYLAAGHGGKDPGAVSGGFQEKDMTLAITLACRDYLKANYKGVTVKCSRTTDKYVNYVDYAKGTISWGADVAVDNHINAGGGDGCEAWINKGAKRAAKLSEAILKELEKLGQNIHGSPVKESSEFAFNKIPECPSPIIEFFFIDSKDREIGDTEAELKALGEAEARGIAKYLNLEKKEDRKEGKKAYTLLASMNVRTGPGTNYSRKKRIQIPAAEKKNLLNRTYAVLRKGTKVTALEVKKKKDSTWIRTSIGWICVKGKTRTYAE